ncbi:hypothetical protein MKK65_11925 [Methylobacterium sp. J-001]|uniref:hypothetical protein n=1 Tax=Methylobacterium sp. J-001 TaxID=2836609 RepID=UPI001FB8DA8E|nr:hypothetical protein [Methylobacterium sp. J-001]MCJ2117259.1 hypothetical protein [Methylobacterium sp. J-001]
MIVGFVVGWLAEEFSHRHVKCVSEPVQRIGVAVGAEVKRIHGLGNARDKPLIALCIQNTVRHIAEPSVLAPQPDPITG